MQLFVTLIRIIVKEKNRAQYFIYVITAHLYADFYFFPSFILVKFNISLTTYAICSRCSFSSSCILPLPAVEMYVLYLRTILCWFIHYMSYNLFVFEKNQVLFANFSVLLVCSCVIEIYRLLRTVFTALKRE